MFCGKCGERIADDSRFCKFCGVRQESLPEPSRDVAKSQSSPRPKDSAGKIIGWSVAVIVLLLIIEALGNTRTPNSAPAENATQTTNSTGVDLITNDASVALTNAPTNSYWSYSSDEDKVRGGTTYYATTTSTNSVHQDFPYSSNTTMQLTVRKSPAYGTDVILRISSGQMMCPSYEGCSGSVRFDDGPAKHIRFAGPADSSSDVVFVEGAKPFIGELRKAKHVVIEKTLYEAGAPQFEFDVGGLKWNH